MVAEDVPPDPAPEVAGAPPAWWQDGTALTNDRVLVFATIDADTLLDARARAIDAASKTLESEHDAEPIAGELILSAAQLDDGRFRVWVRMAGTR